MASGIATYLQNALVQHCFGGTALTQPGLTTKGHLFIEMRTGTITDDSTHGSAATGIARVECDTWTITNNQAKNTNALTFGTTSAAETLTGFVIFDNSTGGNELVWGSLTSNQTTAIGNEVTIAAQALTVTIT